MWVQGLTQSNDHVTVTATAAAPSLHLERFLSAALNMRLCLLTASLLWLCTWFFTFSSISFLHFPQECLETKCVPVVPTLTHGALQLQARPHTPEQTSALWVIVTQANSVWDSEWTVPTLGPAAFSSLFYLSSSCLTAAVRCARLDLTSFPDGFKRALRTLACIVTARNQNVMAELLCSAIMTPNELSGERKDGRLKKTHGGKEKTFIAPLLLICSSLLFSFMDLSDNSLWEDRSRPSAAFLLPNVL